MKSASDLKKFDVQEFINTLNTLDPQNVGSWPLPVKTFIYIVVFVVVLVLGYMLDLSGIRRMHQIEAVRAHMSGRKGPAVLLGDFNEWSPRARCFTAFGNGWTVLAPGRSFPSRRPLAQLDRIVHSHGWRCEEARVHHSALAAVASDHLPVAARLTFTA